MAHILIIEDEPDLASLLQDYLHAEQFSTTLISNGFQASEWIRQNQPDLVLLDLMLPGKSGLDVCREVREFSSVPIIITTAKVEEVDRLVGLESGADDYVCKPYSPKEVVARVKAILRRLHGHQQPGITDLTVQTAQHKVILHGQDTELTTVEFKLFNLLYSQIGAIFTRDQIIHNIYNDHRVVSSRTVDSHVKKIRKKLTAIDPEREFIHAVYGAGYKVEDL